MDRRRQSEGFADKLTELANEIKELERGRSALLEGVERVRAELLSAGRQTKTLSASVEMLRDHAATTVANAAELRAIENEARELGASVTRFNSDSLGLLFEADSLRDTLAEAEDEMERLLSALIEGKNRKSRGH